MKLGRTLRRVVCSKCNKFLGYVEDIIYEGDYNGGIGTKIYCKECSVMRIKEPKIDIIEETIEGKDENN